MWVCLADTIYVATCNPVSLYSMKERGDTIHCMELYDVFPRTISGVWQPFVTVAPLGSPLDGQVVLHEEQVGTRLHFHPLCPGQQSSVRAISSETTQVFPPYATFLKLHFNTYCLFFFSFFLNVGSCSGQHRGASF